MCHRKSRNKWLEQKPGEKITTTNFWENKDSFPEYTSERKVGIYISESYITQDALRETCSWFCHGQMHFVCRKEICSRKLTTHSMTLTLFQNSF